MEELKAPKRGGTDSVHALSGRLTLQSGVPVSTTDQTAQSTLYFTPYLGSRVGLYDGTEWNLYALTEISLALSSLTSENNYDVFLYNNSGTLTLELSNAWTNDTTRADALTTQDGVLVKSSAKTRRYLGTIRTTGTNTTEDSKTKRYVWNFYHRERRTFLVTESTNSWGYAGGANTWCAANNSNTNRVEFVVGDADAVVVQNSTGLGGLLHSIVSSGIGIDSTSSTSSQVYGLFPCENCTTGFQQTHSWYQGHPGLGYHYLQWLEKYWGDPTWFGQNGNSSQIQAGMFGWVEG